LSTVFFLATFSIPSKALISRESICQQLCSVLSADILHDKIYCSSSSSTETKSWKPTTTACCFQIISLTLEAATAATVASSDTLHNFVSLTVFTLAAC
jgi:hypothetical protein